jgi:hypothetical protein
VSVSVPSARTPSSPSKEEEVLLFVAPVPNAFRFDAYGKPSYRPVEDEDEDEDEDEGEEDSALRSKRSDEKTTTTTKSSDGTTRRRSGGAGIVGFLLSLYMYIYFSLRLCVFCVLKLPILRKTRDFFSSLSLSCVVE